MIFILSMFGRMIFILFGLITIENFTYLHVVLVLIIGESSFLFTEDYDWKIYIKIFFFIILIFFILIFVEILELNLCGLQNNTKKNIIERSLNENKDINKFNDMILNDDNNDRSISLESL